MIEALQLHELLQARCQRCVLDCRTPQPCRHKAADPMMSG